MENVEGIVVDGSSEVRSFQQKSVGRNGFDASMGMMSLARWGFGRGCLWFRIIKLQYIYTEIWFIGFLGRFKYASECLMIRVDDMFLDFVSTIFRSLSVNKALVITSSKICNLGVCVSLERALRDVTDFVF